MRRQRGRTDADLGRPRLVASNRRQGGVDPSSGGSVRRSDEATRSRIAGAKHELLSCSAEYHDTRGMAHAPNTPEGGAAHRPIPIRTSLTCAHTELSTSLGWDPRSLRDDCDCSPWLLLGPQDRRQPQMLCVGSPWAARTSRGQRQRSALISNLGSSPTSYHPFPRQQVTS